jgi:hypothetical protein
MCRAGSELGEAGGEVVKRKLKSATKRAVIKKQTKHKTAQPMDPIWKSWLDNVIIPNLFDEYMRRKALGQLPKPKK